MKRHVVLTDREASLVLSNWWRAFEDDKGGLVLAYGNGIRRRRIDRLVDVAGASGIDAIGADAVASCIHVPARAAKPRRGR
jgi:hypothetical protein